MSYHSDDHSHNHSHSVNNEQTETIYNPKAKFPKTSRFFNNSSLPDLKTFEVIRQNKKILFNGQLTNFNYSPFNLPQQKLKASIPLDYRNLPSKILTLPASDSVSSKNEVPCFSLTPEQTKDPIAFIESVMDIGKEYGAVKVKLPQDDVELFQTTNQINSDLFWFQTNKLLNNPPEDEVYMRLKFHHDLLEFLQSEDLVKYEDQENKRGSNASASSASQQTNKMPMIDKRPLDLYKLFQSVMIRGGFVEVINKKLWAQIGRELGYKGKIMTSLSSSLKSSYQKILYPYELYLREKQSILEAKEEELKHVQVKKENKIDFLVNHDDSNEDSQKNLNGKRGLDEDFSTNKRIKTEGYTAPLIIGSAKDFRRSVKSKLRKGYLLNSPLSIDVKQPNVFTIKQDEKKRRRQNEKVDISILPQTQLDSAIRYIANSQDDSRVKAAPKIASIYTLRQFMEKDIKFQEFLVQNNLIQFNNVNVTDRNLISPQCLEKLYWEYISSSKGSNLLNFGLELEMGKDIPNYINGSGFVKMGDDLINYKNYLNSEHLNLSHAKLGPHNLSNSIKTGNSTVNQIVQFDLQRFNDDQYIKKLFKSALHPWNLHNLPILPNALLGALDKTDVNDYDLNESRINIGMTFSTENWTCEDHFTNLINFQFFGAVKKWYFIPELEFEKFERLLENIQMKDQLRSNINNKKQVDIDKVINLLKKLDEDVDYEVVLKTLDNLINVDKDVRLNIGNEGFANLIGEGAKFNYNQEFMITPELLDSFGIRYTTTLQEPGEFIIKFPKTFSSTISFGFNLSEEVNLATKSWLDYALESEKWLAKQNIIPGFLTFKLLVNLALMYEGSTNLLFDSDIFYKAASMYDQLYQEEINLRNEVRKFRIKEVVVDDTVDMLSDDSFANLYPSRIVVTDPKSKKSIIISMQKFIQCQQQEQEEQQNSIKQFQLELQLCYSDKKLRYFSRVLNGYSVDFESWVTNYEQLMRENSDILLKTYKGILSDGEKIYSSIVSSAVKQQDIDQEKFKKFKDQVENLRSFIDNSNSFVEKCQNLLSIKHQQRIRNGNDVFREKSYSYTDLLKLVDSIPQLNFMCSEIEQILEFKNEIENFDKASRLLLSKKNKSIQEFDDLISLGESFGLDIPSLNFIIRIRDRLKWLRTYSLIEKGVDPYGDKNEVFSILDLRKFLDQGISVLSTDDLPMIKEVEAILNASNAFDHEVSKFLKCNCVQELDLNRLGDIAKRFSNEKLFISMNNYHELSKLHINIKLIEQFKELESASYAELKQLHNSVLESGLTFDTEILTKKLESVESWIDSSWNKFCTTKVITTLNKRIDVDHLNSKLTINAKLVEKLLQLLYKSEFSLSEDDKYEESSSYLAIKLDQADALQEDDEITPKYYCVCREYEYGTMVECDKCNEWYHVQCVKDVSNPDADKYICPTCLVISMSSNYNQFLQDQITLGELKEIYAHGELLNAQSINEMIIMKDLIDELTKHHIGLQDQIARVVLQSDITTKLDCLRFILRKLYGNGVLLNDIWDHVLNLIREYEKILEDAKKLSCEIKPIENVPTTDNVEQVTQKDEPALLSSNKEPASNQEKSNSDTVEKLVETGAGTAPDTGIPAGGLQIAEKNVALEEEASNNSEKAQILAQQSVAPQVTNITVDKISNKTEDNRDAVKQTELEHSENLSTSQTELTQAITVEK